MVVEIPLSKQGALAGKYTAIVDDCDADLAELGWSVAAPYKRRLTAYALRYFGENKTRKGMYLHRIILERILGRKPECHELTDHINGNGLDNRRENLRVATHSQNQMNKSAKRGTKAGLKGVSHDKKWNKWIAVIIYNRKRIQLGRFDTPEEAHEAYKAKAIELHGEFARFD